MSLGRVGIWWFAHSLSCNQIKAPHEQTREDFTVVGRVDGRRSGGGSHRSGDTPVLLCVFPLLERAALLRGTRRFGTTLDQDRLARRGFFQGVNSGGRRFRASAKKVRTSTACQAQQASAPGCAFVPAGGEKPGELYASASSTGCGRPLPAFEP